jgi:hypothetical protein
MAHRPSYTVNPFAISSPREGHCLARATEGGSYMPITVIRYEHTATKLNMASVIESDMMHTEGIKGV